ncbi:MAG: hypothetical protein ACKOWF_19100 [Chloroflexota bacterium]
MDGTSFDRWSRALGLTPTRRHGIAALLGGFTLTGCTVSGNTSSSGNGGGVSPVGTGANAPTLTIGAGTAITGNSATGNGAGYLGYGGGVYSQEGTVTVSDPTRLSGNSATVSCNNDYNNTGSNCVIP